jgi:hypothetical protein
MRTCALAVAVVLASAAPSFGQGLSAGVKGGGSFTTVKFEGEPDATSGRWLPAAGAFFVVPFAWGVSLQPEAVYAMKGARLRGPGAQPSLLLDYLEIPVLARVSMRAGGRTIFAVGGAAPAFCVRARTRTKFGSSTEEIDILDEVRRFDAGLVGGAGIEIGRLVVDGRYTFGLINVDKETSDIAHAQNRALTITAGWRFR